MKKSLILLFFLLASVALPVHGEEGFKVDNTPDCPKSVSKGAQNSLGEYAYAQYQAFLDKNSAGARQRLVEDKYATLYSPPFDKLKKSDDEYEVKYPKLTKVDKIQLKYEVTIKASKLIAFALVKHKCDLTTLKLPKLPEEYRY
jgi:hypothetical protein